MFPVRLAAIFADGVLLLHAAVVVFAVFGGLLILVEPWWVPAHLLIVAWSAAVNLASWTCPLTPLEKGLRLRAGQESCEGGWIQHYVEPMVRPLGMPRSLELAAGISIVVWNLIVYGAILWLR